MSTIKLNKKIFIQGRIKVLTGLMIGGTNSSMGIGGPDKTVVRNPFNNEPYIPGSSLKGKIRSLMELFEGYITPNKDGGADPSNDIDKHYTALMFGATNKNDKQKHRPSRIIFRDGKLLNPEKLDKTDLPYTESKTEVFIDRITATSNPRTVERVPAGAEFELNIILNVFEEKIPTENKELTLIEATYKGLSMLQDDYLGGSGSRGSGQVKIIIERAFYRNSNFYTNEGAEEDSTGDYEIPENLK